MLVGALATSRFQRIREGALLRTLGATRSQIFRIVLAEYFALGAWPPRSPRCCPLARGLGAGAVGVRGPLLACRPCRSPRSALAVVALTVLVGLANSREVHPPDARWRCCGGE